MKTLDSFFKKTSVTKISDKAPSLDIDEPVTKKIKSTNENTSNDVISTDLISSEVSSSLGSVEWSQLAYLADDWKMRLRSEYDKAYFKRLQVFIDFERSSHTIYPPIHETFTAFNLCSFDDIRVVIIGQDPYHGPNQAHGLAFSVKKGVQNPPSLQNIFNEAQADVNIRKPRHGNLENWSRQGVFLLNTALTVRRGEANSHQKKGYVMSLR